MKAPYSPDSLQNTLNGKEQFSFNRSKKKEINPYTPRTEKTLTFCGKAGKFSHERNALNLLLIPSQSLPDDILNKIDHWLHAVQHCWYLFSANSDLQVGYITWNCWNKSNSTKLRRYYARGLLFSVSCLFWLFVSKSYLLKQQTIMRHCLPLHSTNTWRVSSVTKSTG